VGLVVAAVSPTGLAAASLGCAVLWYGLVWWGGHLRGHTTSRAGLWEAPSPFTRLLRRGPGPVLIWSAANEVCAAVLAVSACAALAGIIDIRALYAVFVGGIFAVGIVWVVVAALDWYRRRL